MAKNYLAFDLGASSGRAILGTLNDGKLSLRELHRFENVPVKIGAHLYWDTPGIFNELKNGLRAYARLDAGPLSGVGIDTWGVDFGLLDHNDELIGNPIHYRDDQTDGMMEKVFERISRREIYRTTGIAFMRINTLYQLAGMKERGSVSLANASTLLFMPDLLAWMLTGKKGTEYTIASTSQLLDVEGLAVSAPILKALGIPESLFSPIVQPGTLRGPLLQSIAEETLVGDVPVYAVAGHDTASAVVAVPAEGSRHAYLSSGTWSLMGIENDAPVVSDDSLEWNFTNEGGAFGKYRILRNIMGLWIIQECRREWSRQGEKVSFDALTQQAAEALPFKALINPDDDRFFAPGDMPGKVREYCRETGQSVPETRGEIVRCVLESLALRYRWCMERLERLSGQSLDRLHIVGGGIQNRLLCQLSASAIGRPVIAGPIEATAIGNILMQAAADGELSGLAEIRETVRRSFAPETYHPNDKPAWDAAYERFLEIGG
ncbi:MAG: rhamnulokinase [Clostridiales bacterium]|nr:rhamnulokinase [Clostridiales bacterium]